MARLKYQIKKPSDVKGAVAGAVTNFRAVTGDLRNFSDKLLEEVGNIILEESDGRVPVDTGALQQSGRIFITRRAGDKLVGVAYGGPDFKVSPTKNAPRGVVEYALVVHEDLSAHHMQGEAKYLERGVQAAKSRVRAHIVSRLKANARRRGR